MEADFTPLIDFNWTLPLVLVSFLVLLLIMKRFFWDKLSNFMQAREQKVIDAFDNADQVNKVADERLLELNGKLAAIDDESKSILKDSKQRADARAEEIIAAAQEEAAAIKEKARRDIENEQARAMEEMKRQLAVLAVYAAEKIIEKQLDPAQQQEVINGAIEEVGESRWLN